MVEVTHADCCSGRADRRGPRASSSPAGSRKEDPLRSISSGALDRLGRLRACPRVGTISLRPPSSLGLSSARTTRQRCDNGGSMDGRPPRPPRSSYSIAARCWPGCDWSSTLVSRYTVFFPGCWMRISRSIARGTSAATTGTGNSLAGHQGLLARLLLRKSSWPRRPYFVNPQLLGANTSPERFTA